MEYKKDITAYFKKLKETIDKISIDDLDKLINILVNAKEEGKIIFIMGNGGSSATASHYGVSLGQEKKFKFICLNDNIPSLMAYANDFSFEDIFINQLNTFFHEGDVVIGISGSGNSKNVLKAIEYANNNGGITVGLTGYNGGRLKEISMVYIFQWMICR